MSVIPMGAKSPKPGRGGTRSRAGRPRKAPILLTPPDGQDRFGDAQAFLLALLNADDAPMPVRLRAAAMLLPYQHERVGRLSKRERAARDAETAGIGTDWGDLLHPEKALS